MPAPVTLCPGCGHKVLKRDRRCKQPLRPLNGAVLELDEKGLKAPRLKCRCGKVIIFLKGNQA